MRPDTDTTHRPGPDTRLVTLDAMRGLAALAVAAGHLGLLSALSVYGIAVDFFFMLSAYVLLHSYAGRLEDWRGVSAYFKRRAIRLMPLFAVGLGLGGVAFTFGYGVTPARWRDTQLVALDPPGWTLVYEAIASTALGLGFWRRSHALQYAALALGAAGVVIATVHNGSPNGGWSVGQVHYGLSRMLFGFSAGALVYRLRAAPRLAWWFSVVPFAAILLLPFHHFGLVIAAVGLLPVLLWFGARADAMPFARFLGDLSYPLYILHMPIYWMLGSLPPAIRLVVALAAAWTALRLFDQPLRDWLMMRVRRPDRAVRRLDGAAALRA